MVYVVNNNTSHVTANKSNFIVRKTPPKFSIPEPSPFEQVPELLQQFRHLFAVSKLLGVYPYQWNTFQQRLKLKNSKLGAMLVLLALLIVSALYNTLIWWLNSDIGRSKPQSALAFIISLFLTYILLAMMTVDHLNAIRNQSRLNNLFERLHAVDTALFRAKISFDNKAIAKCIRILLILTICFEGMSFLSACFLLHDEFMWQHLLWICFTFPTLYNSLDKIWFIAILTALKIRFAAINEAIDDMVIAHKKQTIWRGRFFATGLENAHEADKTDAAQFDFLRKEFSFQRLGNVNRVTPENLSSPLNLKMKPLEHIKNSWGFATDQNKDVEEEKLNYLCRLHDQLCEIGKLLNELWSYPILILMAYGFLMFTSQLYFFYCATQNQPIPAIFRSAYSVFVTFILLSYTGSKCVYIIYLSWRTSLECKRTGICLHKWGVATDKSNFYHIVNHLSLKLLNHSVDFSACGFFALDMETLFGVSGGITSYLIILIQFNLAAQQAKSVFMSISGSSSSNGIDNGTDFTDNNTFMSTTALTWTSFSSTEL